MDKQKIVQKIRSLDKDDKIEFIVLFGSYLTKNYNSFSDIDMAIFYDDSKDERFKFRVKVSGELPNKYDIQIFQDLPLFIRDEIIKKGKIIYKKSFEKTSMIYFNAVKEISFFKKYLDYYNKALKGEYVA